MSHSSKELGIEQQLDALTGRQPALGMLGLDALDAATGARRRPFILKSLKNFPHGSPLGC